MILTSFSLLASDDHDVCSLVGEGNNPAQVNDLCYEFVRTLNDPNLSHISDDVEVYAYKNLVYINHYELDGAKNVLKERILISGKQSRLKNITSVGYSKKLKRVFILDSEEKAVLSFGDNIGGNIAPKRKLYDLSLDSADQIIIDDTRDEMFVFSSFENTIKVYKSKADVDNRAPAHDVKVLRTLDLTSLGIKSIKDIQLGSSLKIFVIENEQISVEKFGPVWH
jgi:hypothetical protein